MCFVGIIWFLEFKNAILCLKNAVVVVVWLWYCCWWCWCWCTILRIICSDGSHNLGNCSPDLPWTWLTSDALQTGSLSPAAAAAHKHHSVSYLIHVIFTLFICCCWRAAHYHCCTWCTTHEPILCLDPSLLSSLTSWPQPYVSNCWHERPGSSHHRNKLEN